MHTLRDITTAYQGYHYSLPGISLQLIGDITTAYQGYNYSLSGISLPFIRDMTKGISSENLMKDQSILFLVNIFVNSDSLFSE